MVRVNIGLDAPPYGDPAETEDPDSLTALVNQYHALPADYAPKVVYLTAVYTNQRDRLRPVACRAFMKMADAAAREGLRIYNASAYRSYTTQKWVYQRYVNQEGVQEADTYSARPGCSEHQTGLALDINTASLSDHFEETEEYAWLVGGEQLALRLHPPLSGGEGGDHRLSVRALALPLCGTGGGPGLLRERLDPGGVPRPAARSRPVAGADL